MKPLLRIHQLTIAMHTSHGLVPAVSNVNLEILPGETLALVGESGGGKTMISLAIMQLLPLSARVKNNSEIWLGEQELLALPEIEMRSIRGRRIGMIFQEAMTALNPVLTIGEQISEVLRKHFHLTHRQRHQRCLELLCEVGMDEPERALQNYPHQLSGGMRQRAMIAMALAGEPELLIADEPTTALDVTLQAQVIHLLISLQQKRRMSMLFITHDLGVVAEVADKVAVIKHGEIVEFTTKQAFFTAPQNAYSIKLFDALPTWEKRDVPPRQSTATEPLLQLEHVKIYFPVRKGILQRTVAHVKAVDDISLNLYPGRTLALVGESGSGKTTLGKGIIRLIKPTGGQILFDHRDLIKINGKALRQVRSDISIVFQDPFAAMDPRMLVYDILAEGMIAQKIGKNEAERTAKIDYLLTQVGLDPESKWLYPHEFSGGQRQRLCIARSLALAPKLIILDEPTSALDLSVQMQLLQLLEKLQAEFNFSYLLITHNFAVVAYLADEVAVMHHGKLVEHGDVQAILNKPQHVYTRQLLAAVPKIPSPDLVSKRNVA